MTYQEFSAIKRQFFKKHNSDFTANTSPMNQDGSYHKDYIFEDGAQWTECMRPVWREATVQVENVEIKVNVKLFETEAWSTDDATSIFYYERFNHEKEATL